MAATGIAKTRGEDEVCACGNAATSRAENASHAAHQPASHDERHGRRRQHGRNDRGSEPEPEQQRHRRLGERVCRHGPQRHDAELQPQDRGRHEAAGDRRCRPISTSFHGSGQPSRQRRSRGTVSEDRRHRGEGELESRLQQRARRPREQHQRAEGEHMPPVARPGREPRERCDAAGDRRAHDGRLPSHRERIAQHRGDGEEVPRTHVRCRRRRRVRARRTRSARRSGPRRRAGGRAPKP